MTQPTIKEKIENLKLKHSKPLKERWDEEGRYITPIRLGLRVFDFSDEFMQDFVRLICEEMMKSNCDCHCIFLEDKAQEIFKALE